MIWTCKQAKYTEIGVQPYTDSLTPDWSEIIWHHSRCQLTFEKDRLASLQGIAAQLQSTRSDQYIQGLWTGELSDQLAWSAAHGLQSNSDLPDTPSWSWASKLGGIEPLDDFPDRWYGAFEYLSVTKQWIMKIKAFVAFAHSFPYESLYKCGCDDIDKIKKLGAGLDWALGLSDYNLPNYPRNSKQIYIVRNYFGEAAGWIVPGQNGTLDGKEQFLLLNTEIKPTNEWRGITDLYGKANYLEHTRCRILVLRVSTRMPRTFEQLGVGLFG